MTNTNVSMNDSDNDDGGNCNCPAPQPLPLPPSNLKATMPTQTFSSWGDAFSFAASVKPQDLGTFNPPESTAPLDPTDQPGNISAISLIAKEYESSIISKKRKASDADADVGDNDQEGEDDSKSAKAKKKLKKEEKKKKKAEKAKRQKEESSSSLNPDPTPTSTGVGSSPTCAPPESKKKSKKDKKSKKEKKSRKKDETSSDDKNEGDGDSRDPTAPTSTSSPLEGQMIMHNDEALMVLIDRSKNIVYSMDRDEATGQLQAIGTLVNGTVKITGKL